MCRHIDNAGEEGLAEKPVTVIQVCDHMTQENVIRLLSTKEDTEPRDIL